MVDQRTLKLSDEEDKILEKLVNTSGVLESERLFLDWGPTEDLAVKAMEKRVDEMEKLIKDFKTRRAERQLGVEVI